MAKALASVSVVALIPTLLGAAEARSVDRAPAIVSSTYCETAPCHYWHRKAKKRLRLLGKRERRIVQLRRKLYGVHHTHHGGSVRSIICHVFGSQCSKALSVAWCESRFNVYARNGQYLGLFQMGSFARSHYGHSWNAWGQARAAHRYYLDAGWSPWSCA